MAALVEAGSWYGGGQDWTCPAHDDDNPSLGVKEASNGYVLVNCQRGCPAPEVMAALGLTTADLFPDDDHPPVYREVAHYDYTDEIGEPLYRVIRRECRQFPGERCPSHDKQIRQAARRAGRFVGGEGAMTGVRRVLYRLPEMLAAVALGEPIYITEGEKDADLLSDGEGIYATTSPEGAGKWRDEYADALRGATVIVIADHDPAGYDHARTVYESCARAGASVSLALPKPRFKGADYFDHAAAGYGVDDLEPVQLTDLEWPEQGQGGDKDPRESAVSKLAEDLVVRELARERAAEAVARLRAERRGLRTREPVDGATFILDAEPDPEPVWGTGQSVLWAKGEALLIVGPQGVGKSTAAQQIALRRAGLREPALYGYDVAPDDRRVVYLAMDRPAQIRRSLRRMVDEDDRAGLKERLSVWEGPLPVSVLSGPSALADGIADAFGTDVGTVVVDSYKDLAPGLSEDSVGAALNSAMQEVLARGVEWLGLHHQRKANTGNGRPERLEDVYGSVWLTAGTGSVLGLFGQPGAATVEGTHLKQPAERVGPLHIRHDHSGGRSGSVDVEGELLALLADSGEAGVEVDKVAAAFFGGTDKNAKARASRALHRLGAQLGTVEETPGKRGGVGGGGSSARISIRVES